jgi:hypothetical protein
MPLKTILRIYIRAGKLCPDFFFHEPLTGLYAGEKEAKSRVRCPCHLYKRNIYPLRTIAFSMNKEMLCGIKR